LPRFTVTLAPPAVSPWGRPAVDHTTTQPGGRAAHRRTQDRCIRKARELADDGDAETHLLDPREPGPSRLRRQQPGAFARDDRAVPDHEPVRWVPGHDLDRLGERRHPEDPRPDGEANTDPFASITEDLDPVGIEHPVGLSLPVEQDRPRLGRGTGK